MKPPYFAVIFTSILTEETQNYNEMAMEMERLARKQEGFLEMETARNDIGITISYWKSLSSIEKWKKNFAHAKAQELGKEKWYQSYRVRICKVEKEYDFKR